MRIAVCDDDKKDAAVIRDYISTYDARLICDVFHSAPELVEANRKEFYDLVFLDIEMKPMNGFDAGKCPRLRGNWSDVELLQIDPDSAKLRSFDTRGA